LKAKAFPKKRRWLRWVAVITLLGLGLLGMGYWNATRDPIVRSATVTVDNWPQGETPLKVLLLSDTHVAGPDMPPQRLRRIVRQLNLLKPDLVLIAGDLVSEKRVATHIYTPAEIIEPLSHFKSRFGTIVALGNHDHWFDPKALEGQLIKAGATVLKNNAVQKGPLVIGGVDDDFTGQDDIAATFAAMDTLPAAPRIMLSHSPDIVPDLSSPVDAVFAGHTHCGQIVLPLIGAISYVSRYGDRFACGDINDANGKGGSQRVFVGAGLGTSILPLRYGAAPDVWLVTLGPKAAR
jgi:uncharacterized protein